MNAEQELKEFFDENPKLEITINNVMSYIDGCTDIYYLNKNDVLDELFRDSPHKLAKDIHYGTYDYNDEYFYYDVCGLLCSGNADDIKELINDDFPYFIKCLKKHHKAILEQFAEELPEHIKTLIQ